MAVRTILHYPDARLRQPGKKVGSLTPDLRQLIDDMAETMYAAPGVGLAATQVDCAAEGEPSDLRVFVDPEIVSTEGTVTFDEGCLSFPSAREEIERAAKVRVKAQDRDGRVFELEAEGLLAVAIQHEYDHLHGVLMIDRRGL
jgi:peptide deformylase